VVIGGAGIGGYFSLMIARITIANRISIRNGTYDDALYAVYKGGSISSAMDDPLEILQRGGKTLLNPLL
jgi:hypothetical protein